MSVQQDPITPTIWYFVGNPAFVWNALGAQPIYVDDTDRGADHTTGTGGAINTPFGDIYDRLGYLFRGVSAAGNRGYSQNTVKNATGALLPTDSGLITVQTAPVGTAPTAAVTLTLPTRAALVAANIGYFQSIATAPFFNVAGSGIFPFMINGYTNNAGIPLAITVANPTTPSTPTPGMDVGQTIQIGAFSATTIYLYAGDYAEFIPVISNDVNNYWYLTWTVRVHNSNYQKFTKGGSPVSVGTNAYPSTNMDGVSNYFNFSVTAGANLSWMPDSTVNSNYSKQVEGSRLLYIKVNTVATGNAWTLKNNVSSPPTGYKAILTPSGADMSMFDGDILVMAEDGASWVVVSIIGSTNNSSYYASQLSTAITGEVTARNTAITALKTLLVSGTIGGGVDNLTQLTEAIFTPPVAQNYAPSFPPISGTATLSGSRVTTYYMLGNICHMNVQIEVTFTGSNGITWDMPSGFKKSATSNYQVTHACKSTGGSTGVEFFNVGANAGDTVFSITPLSLPFDNGIYLFNFDICTELAPV